MTILRKKMYDIYKKKNFKIYDYVFKYLYLFLNIYSLKII